MSKSTRGTEPVPTQEPGIALQTRELTKRYGTNVAVDRVSLAVRRGEVYGFLGPNGAGKTTTMRMAVGLIRPTGGTAVVLGRPAGDAASLGRTGAVIETPAFYPYLSGRDNLKVVALHAGIPPARIAHVLDRVGLASRAGDRFATYSLGMKQRLGLAAALLKDPELLILDEPSNGLDPIGIADLRALIRTLAQEGRSVFLSSHQLGEVEQVCDRIGVIFRGRLVMEGTVAEIRGGAGLVVMATPIGAAEERLKALIGPERVTVRGDELHLAIDPSQSSAVTRDLLAAGVEVREVRRSERSLEEVFLSMNEAYESSGTRGEQGEVK